MKKLGNKYKEEEHSRQKDWHRGRPQIVKELQHIQGPAHRLRGPQGSKWGKKGMKCIRRSVQGSRGTGDLWVSRVNNLNVIASAVERHRWSSSRSGVVRWHFTVTCYGMDNGPKGPGKEDRGPLQSSPRDGGSLPELVVIPTDMETSGRNWVLELELA